MSEKNSDVRGGGKKTGFEWQQIRFAYGVPPSNYIHPRTKTNLLMLMGEWDSMHVTRTTFSARTPNDITVIRSLEF